MFFRPYKSASDVLQRSATIITAPLSYTLCSAGFALSALFELFKACHKLLLALTGFGGSSRYNQYEAEQDFNESGRQLTIAAQCAVAAIASPFINLMYLIGGVVGSMYPAKDPKRGGFTEYRSTFEDVYDSEFTLNK